MKCIVCKSTEVGKEDYCHGCGEIVCHRCCNPYGHFGNGAHAYNKSMLKNWEKQMAKKKQAELKSAPNIEDLIRLAVRTQARLRKEGIALHWTLSYAPCDPKASS